MRRNEEQIAIYSRKSKFTGKGESIGNQVELCKEYVRNMFGEEYVDRCVVFEDEGFSGGNLQRPDFKRMMEEVRKRKFKAIVVYRLDRISRNISDFTGLIDELTKLDVSFVSIKEQFDTSTPMGRAMMFIISVFSQLERETIAERIRDNMHELAKTGRWLGGNTPTGFKSGSVSKITIDGKERKSYKLIPIPEEIEIPKMIFDLYMETDSLTAVEAELLRQRIKTKQGKDFTRFAIKAILQNPVYMVADEDAYNYFMEKEAEIFFPKEAFDGSCGIMTYNRTNQEKGRTTQLLPVSEWIIAIGKHPGFVPSKQWIKVQESLDRNKSKAYRKPRNNEALLTGLVYCSCGERMYPKLSQRKTASGEIIYTYVCKMKERSKRERCNRRNANGNILDAAIIEQIKSLTDHDSSFISQLAKSREFYTGKREQYERQLEELRVEHEMNEKTINGLIDSLGMVGDSIAKPRVLKRIEELTDINRDVENRIHELEGLVNVNSLTDAEFDLLRQMLSMFRTSIDDMSVEEKRAAIRTVVRKVIWDGVNAHVVLFGADESDIEFPDMDDRLAHMDDESGEEEPLEAFADVDYGDFEEENSGLGKTEPSNTSKSRWGEDSKRNPDVLPLPAQKRPGCFPVGLHRNRHRRGAAAADGRGQRGLRPAGAGFLPGDGAEPAQGHGPVPDRTGAAGDSAALRPERPGCQAPAGGGRYHRHQPQLRFPNREEGPAKAPAGAGKISPGQNNSPSAEIHVQRGCCWKEERRESIGKSRRDLCSACLMVVFYRLIVSSKKTVKEQIIAEL